MGWSVKKTAVVWAGAIILAVSVVLIIAVSASRANDKADRRHLQMEQTCLAHPGYQWVKSDCIKTTS